jgi:hypothetical protein
MLGNYQVATELVASRVVLSSIELVSYFSVPEVSTAEQIYVKLTQEERRLGVLQMQFVTHC